MVFKGDKIYRVREINKSKTNKSHSATKTANSSYGVSYQPINPTNATKAKPSSLP